MSSYTAPCQHQPVDFVRVDHLETIEMLRRTEIQLADKYNDIRFDIKRLGDDPMKLFGIDDEEHARQAREWKEHMEAKAGAIGWALRKIGCILRNFYKYPDDYMHNLIYDKPIEEQGHAYDGFWGAGFKDCPGEDK